MESNEMIFVSFPFSKNTKRQKKIDFYLEMVYLGKNGNSKHFLFGFINETRFTETQKWLAHGLNEMTKTNNSDKKKQQQ